MSSSSGTQTEPNQDVALQCCTKLDDSILRNFPEGTSILSVTPSGTSAWVQTVRIETRQEDGDIKLYFLKSQSGETGRKMMQGTWESESIFHTYSPEHVPKPYAWGNYTSDPNTWFYLCAFHDMKDDVPDARNFVSVVSNIHKESLGKSSQYGFQVPTYLANLPNDNTWQDSWEVWFTQAMRQMFALEEASHGQDDELDQLKEALYSKVIPRLLRPLESDGRSIKPCLVHSDLWPGNSKPDAHTGEVVIFDSCAFWGHNEADLGSWRAPRYRMGRPFLEEYKRLMGMSEPQEDWDDRNALYAIRYDLLNSALFPDSNGMKFRNMAMTELRRLVAKYPKGLAGFEESHNGPRE